MDLKKIVSDKITELGDQAPDFFGKPAATIRQWIHSKGNPPLWAVQKVIDAGGEGEPVNAPVQGKEEILLRHEKALGEVIGYLNAKVIPFVEKGLPEAMRVIQELQGRVADIGAQVSAMLNVNVKPAPTVGQAMGNGAEASLVRPNVTTLATYAEPVGGGPARVLQHPLDSGIAPTAEQAAASRQEVQNAPPGQAPRLAGPAVSMPGAENFGVKGWTAPYAQKR